MVVPGHDVYLENKALLKRIVRYKNIYARGPQTMSSMCYAVFVMEARVVWASYRYRYR